MGLTNLEVVEDLGDSADGEIPELQLRSLAEYDAAREGAPEADHHHATLKLRRADLAEDPSLTFGADGSLIWNGRTITGGADLAQAAKEIAAAMSPSALAQRIEEMRRERLHALPQLEHLRIAVGKTIDAKCKIVAYVCLAHGTRALAVIDGEGCGGLITTYKCCGKWTVDHEYPVSLRQVREVLDEVADRLGEAGEVDDGED